MTDTTPEKCEYCSAREQEHSFGVICEHATPETEGMESKMNSMMRAFTPRTPEKEMEEYIKLKHIPLGDMALIYEAEGLVGILEIYDKIITSRDTYWKEMVRKEVEGERKRIEDEFKQQFESHKFVMNLEDGTLMQRLFNRAFRHGYEYGVTDKNTPKECDKPSDL